MPERYSMIGIKLFLHVKYGQPEFALPRAQNKAIIPLCIHAYLCQIVLIFLFGNKGFFGLEKIGFCCGLKAVFWKGLDFD